ncbi:MAG: prepilin-type N-terminal cleavage/methylation domain-containing protein [Acidobacteriota bacterium]|nr:prepilin-type N-terminal cleavage/methylation domain-containing protein [Acidobacteriota bacterium]
MPTLRTPSRGFSLLEALVVVAVIGILMAAAGPELYRLINKSRVMTAVDCSAILLRKARLRAVKYNVLGSVEMEVSGGQRKLTGNADRKLKSECTLPEQIQTWGVTGFDNLDRPEPAGMALFRGDGSAVEAGAFQFNDVRGNSLRVAIDPAATGRVQITKLEGATWHRADEGKRPWIWQ